jgi:hypothetical protein
VPTIFTHVNVDLDAVCSVKACKEYVPGMSGADVKFRNANWNGDGMKPGDIAVDLDAGGRGIKGEEEGDIVHSCFALLMSTYAPKEDRQILGRLIEFVDILDSRGSVVDQLVPEASGDARAILSAVTLGSVVNALREDLQEDNLVIDAMSHIFSGMLKYGRKRMRALQDMDNHVEFFGQDKQVALITDSDRTMLGCLFRRGVRIAVYSNDIGLGVFRNSYAADIGDFRVDCPEIRAVVEEMGNDEIERGEWFAHLGGFLYCRGSDKSPACNRSKVDPRRLAEAVASAWGAYKKEKTG